MNGKLSRRGFVALGAGLLLGGAFVGTVAAQQAPQAPWGPGACPMGAGMGPWSGGPTGVGPGGAGGTMHAAIAAALGMSTDELFAALRSGKTVAQIAQEKGVDFETVVKAALDAHDKALDAQVAAGRLTREQADWMDAHMEANVRAMLSGQYGPGMGTGRGGPATGPGRGGPGMGPGMGPGWGPGMGPGRGGPGMMPGGGPSRPQR
ncbi:MAG: hypothetical protein U0893_04410 [Chloroflexota bacterium]